MKVIEVTQHIIPNTEEGKEYADYWEQRFREFGTYRSRYDTDQIVIETRTVSEVTK